MPEEIADGEPSPVETIDGVTVAGACLERVLHLTPVNVVFEPVLMLALDEKLAVGPCALGPVRGPTIGGDADAADAAGLAWFVSALIGHEKRSRRRWRSVS